MELKEILEIFKNKKFRATPQRIAVYKFLSENPIHPDVETVYENVLKDNPTFSRTTVYNALKSLAEYKIIIPVMIDNSKIRYDADTNLHGHFMCKKCEAIYDFKVDGADFSGLEGFAIDQKDVYFSGICFHCLDKNN